jgi:hypothetical protein
MSDKYTSKSFDYAGARASGFSDMDVINHLSKTRGFDLQGARKEGYSDDDILTHLTRGANRHGLKGDGGVSTEKAQQARAQFAQVDPRRLDNKQNSSVLGVVDNVVRGIANAATFGFADEIAAKVDNLTGIDSSGRALPVNPTEQDRLQAQRLRDDNWVTSGAEIAGQVAMPFGVAAKAAKGANAVTGTVGRTAAIGTGTGALQGAGDSEATTLEGRLGDAGGGAALGGVFGLGIGAAAKGVSKFVDSRAVKGLDDIQAVKASASELFKQADDLGITFKPQAIQRVATSIEDTLTKESVTRRSPLQAHVDAFRAVDYIKGAATGDKPLNWSELTSLRRELASDMATSKDPNTRRLLGTVLDEFDGAIVKVQPGDLQGATSATVMKAFKTTKEAREGWKQAAKAERLENLLFKVESNGDIAQRSDTKAIKAGIVQLRNNPKVWKQYTAKEKAMLNEIAATGTLEKAWDLVEGVGRLSNGRLSSLVQAGAAIQSGGASLLGQAAVTGIAAGRDAAARGQVNQVKKLIANNRQAPEPLFKQGFPEVNAGYGAGTLAAGLWSGL